uniref:Sprouty-related, EVH1 domain-containing protein 2 n=2 Tax=Paramormyrops kingsleyae TaxID=1676925 RepID=A0A3B3RMS3_9TELE
MTEETHPDDDTYIVRVKGVVMTRDDSSGGWLAQEGGGLSRVGVYKVLPAELPGQSDFLIRGERLKDKQVILECILKKDLVYIKATPTFHHWKVNNRKFGLTFQSPADARAFDRGVRKAMEDLADGSTTSSSTLHNEADLGDDDVFTNATDSSSNSSQRKESYTQPLTSSYSCEPGRHRCLLGHLHEQHRPSDQYFPDQPLPRFPRRVWIRDDDDEEIVRINPRERRWLATGYEDYRHTALPRDRLGRADGGGGDAYVHFDKADGHKHDYSYPYAPGPGRKGDGHAVVVGTQPCAKADGELLRCVYCREAFERGENRRGHCPDAPDPVRACIRRASCLWCADSLLYHCLSDPEGDYSDPCSCEPGDERFCLRWMALAGLSLLVPCMCCYVPLRACHRAAVACHCCGGKHKAVRLLLSEGAKTGIRLHLLARGPHCSLPTH